MITITIRKTTNSTYEETTNYLVKETPTEVTEQYGNNKEVKMIKEYKTELATKTKSDTVELLNQNILDEEKFNLIAVIKAINNV